jgi:hypothetical protein
VAACVHLSQYSVLVARQSALTVEVVKVIASVCQISCCTAIMTVSNILSVFHKVKAKYPFIEKYHNAWPVNMLIQQYLNNHRNNLRAKAAADEGTPDVDPDVAGPSTATPTGGEG